MSLLGSQVYANSDTPCWLSADSAGPTGTLTVANLDVTNEATVANLIVNNGQTFPAQGKLELAVGGNVGMEISSPSGIDGQINTNDNIYFGRKGTNGGATFITPGIALNTDVVNVGGTLTVTGTVSTSKVILPTVGAAASAGRAAIPVGTDVVIVPTTAVDAGSTILITRQGVPVPGPGNGSGQHAIMVPSANIVPGVSFEAYLVDPATGILVSASLVDAEFNWVIIN